MKNKSSSNLTLFIGDKNLSSWSMRPWLVLKSSGLPFKEIKILLDQPTTKKQILRHSPSGRVPALKHGDLTIWDSLAICEYIAELAPEQNLWPADPAARAQARSYVAEMHSSFSSLRQQLSMDLQLKMKIKHLTNETVSDIERVLELWTRALKKSGGPFLFGAFGIVDAFYAPVLFRFSSYGINIKDPRVKKYIRNMKAHPSVKAWVSEGLKERPYYLDF